MGTLIKCTSVAMHNGTRILVSRGRRNSLYIYYNKIKYAPSIVMIRQRTYNIFHLVDNMTSPVT